MDNSEELIMTIPEFAAACLISRGLAYGWHGGMHYTIGLAVNLKIS